MESARRSSKRSLSVPALLVAVLGGLLLLGGALDRLPTSPAASPTAGLRGSQRRVVENLAVLPSDLGGPGQPTFSPPQGSYAESVRVELRADDRRAVVIYTTDGSLPTGEHGMVYQHPLLLDAQQPNVTVIRATQLLNGTPGPDVTAVYAVGLESELPILSLVAEPDDLWGGERGVLANPSFRGADWERPVYVTFLNDQEGFAIPAGLRIHGTEPSNVAKQSLRLYFRSETGAARLDYALFPGHPEQPEVAQSYNRLLLQAGDRGGWWTLFRDELTAQTARSIGLLTAQARFVHLFINGSSWGLYRLSERVDRFFLADNYGYRDVDVVQEGRAQEGSDEEWDALVDWAVTHDLANAEAYGYVQDRLDVDDFADYAVLQLYFGFAADDLYAVRDRGERWRFVYGGGAQSFAQRPEDTLAALRTEDTDLALLLRALLDNADFRNGLGERATLLLNTTLSPEAMGHRVTILADTLSADVGYEEARWATPTQWVDNVAQLRAFVTARPAALRKMLGDDLGLARSVTAQVRVDPADAGTVFAGGLPLPSSVEFILATTVELIAVPHPGFALDGWEGAAGDSTSAVLRWMVDGPREIVARFRPIGSDEPGPYPNDVVISEYWINDNGTRYRSLDDKSLTGDWVELLVRRPESVDLRGWRLTDNDTRTGAAEGSLILPNLEAFAAVPRDTAILIVATENLDNAASFPSDDLDSSDGRMVLYAGNGNLGVTTDPGFAIGTRNEALVLLAPGQEGELGIDFVAEGDSVTPYEFGVLADGVVFDAPFRYLGQDDGAVHLGIGSNDDGSLDWLSDPSACQSGDASCLDVMSILTPGGLSARQRRLLWWRDARGKLDPWPAIDRMMR